MPVRQLRDTDNILRGICLIILGLQLVMTIGMPSWSLIPGTIEDLSTSVGFELKKINPVSYLF